MKLLLVTNDFPPRVGGFLRYLWYVYSRVAARGVDITVLAPRHFGDAAFDASSGMTVERWETSMWRPTPALDRRIRQLARAADVVVFGAVVPTTLLATRVGRPVVIHTYGHELAWARLPILRSRLRALGRSASLVTALSAYTLPRIARALGDGARVELLRTGVDLERFTPDADGSEVRKRHGLGGRPVVACVSRLVLRKGQDQIIRAMPHVRRAVPDAVALIVGDGPARAHLKRLARAPGVGDAVVFTGEVPEGEIVSHYAAGDVFAMPCRSRLAGLEVEGLGLVYLEAQACARPAIAGDSGGAPEAVAHDESGFVVPGRDVLALARALTRLLGSPEDARRMGEAGRRFVEREYDWARVADAYTETLRSL